MQARGKQIRRKREEAGYGLTAFAKRVGISPSWLSRIERDQADEPSPEVLRRIADELGAAIKEIARHE
ncbi:helix-turn-helix transcriptional regulator [Streptomyces sp. NPDC046853]|uniref:helix-turn-helix domain-containing protein n=1 Tax=Streptomyces sp. NPDC046853 TaxID=3154920 RepID=UPI0033E9DAE7